MLQTSKNIDRFYRHLVLACFCLGICVGSVISATNPSEHEITDHESLLEVQQRVSQVVSDTMAACVAITDGEGFGSGVIVNENGLILTAGHVMADEKEFEIILPSGRKVSAKALGKNLNADAGMLQIIEPGPWPFVDLSNQSLKTGQWVVSLGHSGGYELGRLPPVRTGRVLELNRDQIITDAVLIGGDSGGPLFDLNGKLVAIHSSIGDSIVDNRHVKISVFKKNWDRLKSGTTWGQLPDLNHDDSNHIPGKMGVKLDLTAEKAVIRIVKPSSPAERIGLQVGDIVAELFFTEVLDGPHLMKLVREHARGEQVPLIVLRNGNRLSMEIRLR